MNMRPSVSSSAESPKKFPFGNLLKILLALFLVWLVLLQTNFSSVIALWGQVSLPWLGLTFLLYVALTFFKAFQYHAILGGDTPYLRIVGVVIWQNALTNFVAAGAGVASYLALLKTEEGVKLSKATLTFLITKVGDLFSVWVVFIACSTFLWGDLSAFHSVIIVLIILIGLGLLFFGATILFRDRFASLLSLILDSTGLSRFTLVQKGMGTVNAIVAQNTIVIYRAVRRAFTLSFIYYLLTLVWMVASMRMFNTPAGVWDIVFVSCILQLISVVPISIFGSLGVTEFTSLYLYSIFGISQALMSPILLAWRAVFYLMNLAVLLYLPINTFIFGRSSRT